MEVRIPQGYNVLSNERYRSQMFDFDLQLFGGGGGKRAGKIVGMLAFAAVGWYNPGMFGLASTAHFGGAVMAASLFSSVWSAFSKKDNNNGNATVNRFERSQETMSSNGQLPVVYGRRQISGNQTFHKTDSDASTLWKHVVLCEGGIEGIESVTANDLLIPTGSQTSGTVFTIQNVKYKDATVSKYGHNLTLSANGKSKTIYLCNKDDMGNTDASYWDYQVSISSLISYINRMNEGWQCFPVSNTNKYPGDLSQSNARTGRRTKIEHTYNPRGGVTGTVPSPYAHYEESGGYYYELAGSNCYLSPVAFRASTVSGETKYTFHDCSAPSNYNEVGGYPNMAWLDMKFVISSELNGNPNVTCLIKGRKVYDIRTGKTAYSTNPAMCLRDFLLSKRYGMGKWFDESMLDYDSWAEAADYCDEVITFLDGQGAQVRAKRYELNMVIDSKRSALEWVQEILANFCGYLVYSNGKLKLKIEKETPVSYKFTDDNCADLKISPLPLSETPNRYEVTIIDPLNNWTAVKCLCDDYADQKERQKIITKDVNLEGVTSQNQALRLARFYRDYNLVCPMQVSFSTGMQGMHLEPGDVVTLSYHGVFTDMPIRISEIKETNKGTFEISGRQYNDTIYGDYLGGGIHWYNYSEIQTPLAGDVPDVTSLIATEDTYVSLDGSSVSTISLTWKAPAGYTYVSSYIIDYSLDGKTWITAGSAKETQFAFSAQPYQTYRVRVRVENTVGRVSSGVITTIRVTGKNAPPNDVTGLQYRLANRTIQLNWDAVADPDLRGYNIYMGVNGAEKSSCELYAGNYSANMILVPIETAQDYIFFVEAVDTVGNISVHPAYVNVHLDPLPAVTGFFGVKNGDNINFFWDSMGGYNYEIRWGSSWGNGQVIAKINSNVYTHFFPLIGTQTFFIKAYDGLGLYSNAASFVRMDLTPAQTRNVIAEFDEREAGWQGAKVLTYVSDDSLVKGSNIKTGEYYTAIKLNKEVEARNWIEYDVISAVTDYTWDTVNVNWEQAEFAWPNTEGNYLWIDADRPWTSYEFSWKENKDKYPVEIVNYISTFNELDNYLYAFTLDGNTDGAEVANGVTYERGRFLEGALIKDTTQIDYSVNIPEVFNLSFNARHNSAIESHIVYMTLQGANGYLRIEYKNGIFRLTDSVRHIDIPMEINSDDILNFYLEQRENERIFTVFSSKHSETKTNCLPLKPMGVFNELRLRG